MAQRGRLMNPEKEARVSTNKRRTLLVALLLLVAATAIAGGIALATGLEGGRFPPSWLAGTPFADYVAPGLILAMVVGGSAAAASIAIVRRSPIGTRLSRLAGILLLGWIAGEVILVRADHELVSPMEALYAVVGLAISGLSVRIDRSAGLRPAPAVTGRSRTPGPVRGRRG
jgi:hypothetical protein